MKRPQKPEPDGRLLTFLYQTMPGRLALKFLSARPLSRMAGRILNAPFSRLLIPPFIRHFHISLRDYEPAHYACFNDFFCRKIKPGRRPADLRADALIAPCDGLLSAYKIREHTVIPVKQSRYSIRSLLAGDPIYKEYANGVCLAFRLCVNHYHRYCYVDDGVKGGNHFIAGKLHTVRPAALKTTPVFTENCREYTILQTKNFGTVIQMEVGAMLVGKISNYHEAGAVRKGQEKGKFLYGGSTVIVLLKKNTVKLPHRLFDATNAGYETPVRMGEKIGTAIERS